MRLPASGSFLRSPSRPQEASVTVVQGTGSFILFVKLHYIESSSYESFQLREFRISRFLIKNIFFQIFRFVNLGVAGEAGGTDGNRK